MTARVLAAVCGLVTVLGAASTVPTPARWWLAGIGVLAAVLPAFSRALAGFETLAMLTILCGVVVGTATGRLSVLGAGGLGLLLVAYLLLNDLAATTSQRRATAMPMLSAWIITHAAGLLAAVGAVVGVCGLLLLPVPPLAALLVAAPVFLLAAVGLAMGSASPVRASRSVRRR